jgi:hypothetical protein
MDLRYRQGQKWRVEVLAISLTMLTGGDLPPVSVPRFS